ncbi:MAG TPA: transcriptional regulator [Dehalococcoidia bacterium]|jgi:DNA-binding HxlR family transcriptional regulator|nr:transcriptional regulator [Dehalococcoidia bacterium]HIL31172.1 transcriptional regulator [Dehalococcoidia bacterium]
MNCDTPCPKYEQAMRVLGKKWTCLILRCLLAEPRRFTEISGYIDGLSDRLLSQRLQELEEEGIVQRRVFARRPVVVEYSLSPKGLAFRTVAEAIQLWADEWAEEPVKA